MKRLLCMLMAMMMLFSVAFPMSVFAGDLFEDAPAAEEVQNDSFIEESADNGIVEENNTGLIEENADDSAAEDTASDNLFEEPAAAEQTEAVIEAEETAEPEEAEETAEPEETAGEADTAEEAAVTETVDEVSDSETFDAAGPTITVQPEDCTVMADTKASFSVVATGSGTLSYKWQYRTSPTASWTTMKSTESSTTLKATAERNGWQLRVTVKDSKGSTVSDIVTMTVNTAGGPTINTQPQSVEAAVDTKAVFSVDASGSGTLSYKWEYRTSKTGSWITMKSTTNSTNLKVEADRSGWQVRVTVSDRNGSTVSDIATLTVKAAGGPTITTQPKDTEGVIGTKVNFSVKATGTGTLSYKWEYRKSSTGSWITMASTTSSTSFKVAEGRDGWQFRVTVTDSTGSTVSDIATLSVKAAGPTITTQPKDAEAAPGTKASFSVKATGTGTLTYKWEYRKSSTGSWTTMASTSSSTTLKAEDGRTGWQVRVTVSDSNGSTVSNVATLTVKSAAPVITTQPQSVEAEVGTTATFSVKATGSDLTYKWQYRKTSTSSWTTMKSTTNSTDVTVKEDRDGWQIRVTVSNAAGSVTSDIVTLTLKTSAFVVNNVTYTKLTDTTCAVTGYSGSAASLVIPETVNGLTVTEIGEGAFEGNTTLKSIDLPDSITVIRARAFKGCSSLSEMK